MENVMVCSIVNITKIAVILERVTMEWRNVMIVQ